VAKFYFAIVTALGATVILAGSVESSKTPPLLDFGIFILFAIGVLVLVFDLRLRAHASRVALSIRNFTMAPQRFALQERLPLKRLLDADLIFTVIIMLINAGLVLPIFEVLSRKGVIVSYSPVVVLAASLVVFVVQLLGYVELFPRVAKKMDEWPNDSLVVPLAEELNKKAENPDS
jgi:hypothetical protein